MADSSATPTHRGTTVLRYPCEPIRRPAGSTIRLRRGRNRTTILFAPFWRRDGVCITLLVVANLIWDGFFLALASTWLRHFDLMTFLYTLPFGLVGLALLSPFFVPYGRQVHVFTPDKAVWRWGVIPRRKWTFSDELAGLARLEIRGVCTFSLVLISKDGKTLHKLSDLNESDARWLGNELLADFHKWGLLGKEQAPASDAG